MRAHFCEDLLLHITTSVAVLTFTSHLYFCPSNGRLCNVNTCKFLWRSSVMYNDKHCHFDIHIASLFLSFCNVNVCTFFEDLSLHITTNVAIHSRHISIFVRLNGIFYNVNVCTFLWRSSITYNDKHCHFDIHIASLFLSV
jgi:hypothetical protein